MTTCRHKSPDSPAASASTPPPSQEQRLSALRRFGDFSLAYSTACQAGLSHWGDDAGYLAYATQWGCSFVLGDPVARADDAERLIRSFVARRPRTVFVQCSRATAAVAEKLGMYVNAMGVDTRLALPEFHFGGRDREWLRYASNWVTRRGMRVVEHPLEGKVLAEVGEISRQWRQSRTFSRREVGFLNRPMTDRNEPDVRYFFLEDATGGLQAFVFFDPLYQDGRIVGYCTCIKRRRPDATTYAEAALMKAAIETFQNEGRETLTLGLSPLAALDEEPFRYNPVLRFSFRTGFRARWVNRWFYALQGHAQYKRRFRGEEEPVFFASRALFNDLRIIALLRRCGVF